MNSSEPFLIRPENHDVFLGEPFRSRVLLRARAGLWALVLLEGLLLWGLAVEIEKGLNWLRLRTSGVQAPARVTALWCDSDSEHPSWFVRYQIETDGRLVEGSSREEEITNGYCRQLQVGGTVPVVYLPEAPAVSRVTEDDTWRNQVAINTCFLLPLGMTVLWILLRQQRKVRLLRDGRILDGELLTCIGELDSGHDFCIRTTFAFVSPGGSLLSGKAVVPRDDLKNAPLPGPKSKVAILYLNDCHYQVL